MPDKVQVALGMKVMVTQNLETDLDITNGARGTVVGIKLDPNEPEHDRSSEIHLKYPPAFVLVKLDRTRASQLPGLDEGVIPVEPRTLSFRINVPNSDRTVTTRTVKRRQLPMTAAYAFTDYRSQGQTLQSVIVDIAAPPSGRLSMFHLYVVLSRSRGRDTIRLLRDYQ